MEVQLQAALITASAVVLGLVLQGVLAVVTLRQRSRSDDREARWARIQWAVDRTLEEDLAAQEVGAAALYALVEEPSLEPRDREVVEAALSELEARNEDALDALQQAALAEAASEEPEQPQEPEQPEQPEQAPAAEGPGGGDGQAGGTR